MKAFRAATFDLIHRNVSSIEAIKHNYHTNKDGISHADCLRTQRFGDNVRLRSISVVSSSPKSEFSDTIDAVLELVHSLMEISLKINQYYGRQILCALTSAFVCITVQLYFLIIDLRSDFVGLNIVLAACSSTLIAIHLVEFGAVLTAGDKAKKEVCRATPNIEDFTNSKTFSVRDRL